MKDSDLNEKKSYIERADKLRHDLILMLNKNMKDFNANLKTLHDSSWNVNDALSKSAHLDNPIGKAGSAKVISASLDANIDPKSVFHLTVDNL